MKGSNLGEFEELVLLATVLLHPDAYGVSIQAEVSDRTGRSTSLSAVHAALLRLENKGFVSSKFGAATSQRGGKRKKFIQITPAGEQAIAEARTVRESLWQDIQTNLS